MATTEWIESADTYRRARRETGPKSTFSSYGDHLMVMAAQEEAAAAAERQRAVRAVHRIAGDDAPELLDILGLATPDHPDAEPVDEREGTR